MGAPGTVLHKLGDIIQANGGSWPDNEPSGMTEVMYTDGSDKFFGVDPATLSGTEGDGNSIYGVWSAGGGGPTGVVVTALHDIQ